MHIIRYRNIYYLLLFFVILGPVNLYAGGQKEDRIPQAMALVEERRYNDAILLLTEIMKTNPDQFAEAQKLIQEISVVRSAYNDLYAQLIEVLDPPAGEAIDEDRAYEIIKEMENLDSDPNKAAVAAFAQARESIVFAVNDRAYDILMETAAAQISRKGYTEAIETYLGGFSLHREGFVEKDYGNIVEDQIAIYQDGIRVAARGFLNLYNTISNGSKEYSQVIKRGLVDEIEDGYADYSIVMLKVSTYWRTLKGIPEKLNNIRLSVQREDESDIPYISTTSVLVTGRHSSEIKEGISGILSYVWDDAQSSVYSEIILELEDSYRDAVDKFEASSFSESRDLFSATGRLASVVVNVLKLRGDMLYMDSSLAFKDSGIMTVNAELPDLLFAQSISESVLRYKDLSLIAEELNSISKTVEAAGSVEGINEAIFGLDNIQTGFNNNKTAITEFIDEQSLVTDSVLDLTKTKDSMVNLKNNLGILNKNIFTVKVRSEERKLTLEIEPVLLKIADSIEVIQRSATYVEGVDEIINGLPQKVKRPDRAEDLLTQTKTDLEAADTALTRFIKNIEDGKDSAIKSAPSIIIQLNSAADLKSDIRLRKQEIDKLLSKAKILNDEADDAYSFGILRLDEAYGKFDREDFDGARKKYYEAETLFLKSLEFREDVKVRNLLTGELARLDSDITLSLNRKIISEVRQLINRGKDYYNLQEFIKAEQSLQQAQARYKITNEDNNPEVDNWLAKVKRALEATSGREIAITDPLYSDIIAILNRAGEEFEEGKTLLKSNGKDEAEVHFSEAIKNIELIKEPFPRNFKASVLYLQILEYTQQETFNSFFQSMYDTAISNISNDPKTADDDLLALYQINPDFSGIKTAVYRSGVASGRIIPPPAQVDIKRATDLYKQAKTIVDLDRRSQFPIALAYLEEAILINSDYDAAAILMDKIRTSTGGISEVAMSTSDTQQLRYAESLYIEGRYLEANIIINQLWNNPLNRKSSKLNDLKTKVEARL
ncbi:MAG: hypothetical protein KAR21_08885 [Spirochaetales bacterium]|nr:hypothetical protein [Spirochaetales bacterium]